MTTLWLATCAALLVVTAALAFWWGRRNERQRWTALHAAARYALRRAHSVKPSEVAEGDIHRVADALTEVTTALIRHFERSHQELDGMRRALDGLDEGVVLVERSGRIVEANRAAIQQFGSLFPLVRGRFAIEVFQRAAIDRALNAVWQDGAPRQVEYRDDDSGRTFEVRLRLLPTAQADENGPFTIIAIRDITEIREVERMRRDFVTNASHELRTPLTVIKGYAETLLEDALDAKASRPYLERIVQNADVMTRIVNDMLVLARVESFETPFHPTATNLADEVTAALERMQALFDSRNIHVQTSLEGVEVLGDSDQLQHVASNLLSNAAQYTPLGGTVYIRTGVAHVHGQAWAELVVEDTGVGVPKGERTRIFERFYRVDKGRSRASGGTGLGLAIVKHIVLRHGGRVWAEGREPEPGTRFVCLFPLLLPDAGSSPTDGTA